MSSAIIRALRNPPQLTRIDALLCILPAALWGIVFSLRDRVIRLRCAQEPQNCSTDSLWNIDRWVVGLENAQANALSFVTQNGSAYLAFLIPAVWVIYIGLRTRASGGEIARQILTDFLILWQITLWNGFATELMRLIVQRPRPFVYTDPSRLGLDPAHYTSFYSGHTSFAAAATTALVLAMLGRAAPRLAIVFCVILGLGLTYSTGLFRVLSSRHFVTDVMVAAVAGTIVAIAVALSHRTARPSPAA